MNRPFDLVVLDVGSVLVEAGRSLADDLAIAGFSVEPEWLAAFESRTAALPRTNVGAISIADFAVAFADMSEGRFTAADALRIAGGSVVREYPDVPVLFDALDAASVDAALLSNVNEAEWVRLFPPAGAVAVFPTLSRARYRFSSHLMRVRKPDARAYIEVERGTGRAGASIVFFDDREENVAAARARGWTAELIDHGADTVGQIMRHLRRRGVIG